MLQTMQAQPGGFPDGVGVSPRHPFFQFIFSLSYLLQEKTCEGMIHYDYAHIVPRYNFKIVKQSVKKAYVLGSKLTLFP